MEFEARQAESSTPIVYDIDESELVYSRGIGVGAFGSISEAKWRDKLVAVKKYNVGHQHRRQYGNEIQQLSRAIHTNIVRLFAKIDDQLLLVIEHSDMGSLQDILDDKAYRYNSGHAISWARQAAAGLACLHKLKALHRDVKPANMLLFDEGVLLKLCDFGTSCIQCSRLSNQGSTAWIAPEVWQSSKYNEKCDVYSWAVTFWQILSRRQPFNGCIGGHVMWKVITGGRLAIPQNCPAAFEKLITDCWDAESSKRPSMTEVAQQLAQWQQSYPNGTEPLKKLELLDTDFRQRSESNTRSRSSSINSDENCSRDSGSINLCEDLDFGDAFWFDVASDQVDDLHSTTLQPAQCQTVNNSENGDLRCNSAMGTSVHNDSDIVNANSDLGSLAANVSPREVFQSLRSQTYRFRTLEEKDTDSSEQAIVTAPVIPSSSSISSTRVPIRNVSTPPSISNINNRLQNVIRDVSDGLFGGLRRFRISATISENEINPNNERLILPETSEGFLIVP